MGDVPALRFELETDNWKLTAGASMSPAPTL
jgi:hypothetical protein